MLSAHRMHDREPLKSRLSKDCHVASKGEKLVTLMNTCETAHSNEMRLMNLLLQSQHESSPPHMQNALKLERSI